MSRLPKPASFLALRSAIIEEVMIRFWYHGETIEAEPHALLQANRSGAFVLAAWHKPDGWSYYRFAEMRGLLVTNKRFSPRPDTPTRVPTKLEGRKKEEA